MDEDSLPEGSGSGSAKAQKVSISR